MKKFVLLLPFLFLFFACSKDEENHVKSANLIGTWELTKAIYNDHTGIREDIPEPGEHLVEITEDYWTEYEYFSDKGTSFEYAYHPQRKEVVIMGIVFDLDFPSNKEMVLKRTSGTKDMYYKRIK